MSKHLQLAGVGKGYLGAGILDDESCQQLSKNIFDRYDKERKEFLSITEISNILIDMYRSINKHFSPSKQDVDGFIRILDVNKDGRVDVADMHKTIQRFLKVSTSVEAPPPHRHSILYRSSSIRGNAISE